MENLEQVPLVSAKLGAFLKGKPLDTIRDKIKAISGFEAALLLSESTGVSSYTESEMKLIMSAILVGDYVVDTGRFYINTSKPIGGEEYLAIDSIVVSDGKEEVKWITDSLENAKLFTKEEIDGMVPSIYRSEQFLVPEWEVS